MEPTEKTREMRTAPRYPLDARAKVCFPKDGFLQRVNVRTINIGINGVAITSPLSLPEGTTGEFEVMLPGSRVPLRIKAAIRNRHGFRYGIEFLSASDAQRDDITKFGNGRKPSSMVGTGLTAAPAVN